METETMEVEGAMAVLTLMAGLSLAAGMGIEVDFLAVERDIRGLITRVAMVGV